MNHEYISHCNDQVYGLIQEEQFEDAIEMLLKCEKALEEEKSHEHYLSELAAENSANGTTQEVS